MAIGLNSGKGFIDKREFGLKFLVDVADRRTTVFRVHFLASSLSDRLRLSLLILFHVLEYIIYSVCGC
jgi:hypothetical protein